MLQKHILVKANHPQDRTDTPAPVIIVLDVDIYFFYCNVFPPVDSGQQALCLHFEIRPFKKTLQKLDIARSVYHFVIYIYIVQQDTPAGRVE